MTSLIEHTLINLIPRHSGPLPAELIELSRSLLAQSKSKASNLKAEEEVARLYACANLACERLKTTLNLSTIEPRPPIPPRQYRKLYTYFDKTLRTTKSTSTPKSRLNPTTSTPRNHPSSPTPSRPISQKATPSKSQSLNSFRRTPKHSLKYDAAAQKAAKIPRWIAPTVRALCRAMGAGRAVGYVLAGVESVLTLPTPDSQLAEEGKKRGKDEREGHKERVEEEEGEEGGGGGRGERGGRKKMEGKLPALIAAIWFFVARRLSGKETSGKEYALRRKRVLEVLNNVREDEVVRGKVERGDEGGKVDAEEGWKGWEVVAEKDVNAWLTEISEEGWLEMEWLSEVEEGRGLSFEEGEEEDEEEDEDRDQDGRREQNRRIAARELSRGGLGTMRQDRYDLSEDRREEYEDWKAYILAKCDEIEAEEGVVGEEMDTAEG